MTDTHGVVRHLGGEAGHRSFFGGAHSRVRLILLGLCITAGLVLTPLLGWVGVAAPAAVAAVVLLLTAQTHRGSILERRRRRARWRDRRRTGTDRFVPFDDDEWNRLHDALRAARRKQRPPIASAIAAMRGNPDGADGMGWLQHQPGLPGVAWHHPVGERPYLSVAFAVSGQLRGVESTAVLTRAATSWGAFLAGRAGTASLVGSVQTLTRVLPPETARQQHWVSLALDPDASVEEQRSYAEVIQATSADAMVQRHYIVVTWPLTAAFVDTAGKYGAGRDGWRALMAAEIDAVQHGLADAHLGQVTALTARQVAALMLHQQDPHRLIDAVRHVDPLVTGVESRDEFSAHVVTTTDAATGLAGEWWHRTAAIRADAMAVAPRTQLWLLDLLIGRELTFIRTVSFHIHLVPAIEAKAAARRDVVRDLSDQAADQARGRLGNEDSTVAVTAAQRRRADLASGSHHHGVEWIAYVTVTAPSRDGLAVTCRQLADVCSSELGIDRLEWQDSYQSAASGTTWPIGRGLAPARSSLASRLYGGLAGRSEQEALA